MSGEDLGALAQAILYLAKVSLREKGYRAVLPCLWLCKVYLSNHMLYVMYVVLRVNKLPSVSFTGSHAEQKDIMSSMGYGFACSLTKH